MSAATSSSSELRARIAANDGEIVAHVNERLRLVAEIWAAQGTSTARRGSTPTGSGGSRAARRRERRPALGRGPRALVSELLALTKRELGAEPELASAAALREPVANSSGETVSRNCAELVHVDLAEVHDALRVVEVGLVALELDARLLDHLVLGEDLASARSAIAIASEVRESISISAPFRTSVIRA